MLALVIYVLIINMHVLNVTTCMFALVIYVLVTGIYVIRTSTYMFALNIIVLMIRIHLLKASTCMFALTIHVLILTTLVFVSVIHVFIPFFLTRYFRVFYSNIGYSCSLVISTVGRNLITKISQSFLLRNDK